MAPNRRNWIKQMSMALAGVSLFQSKMIASGQKESPIHLHPALTEAPENAVDNLMLGAFSMSLSVKDLSASKDFYENLGFSVFGGDLTKNYLIMKNQNALIGLFHGMFKNNILTFNPGWDEHAKKFDPFDDVRKIQQHLKLKGVKIETEADEKTTGPASLIVLDPDGNTILIDQHR